MFRNAAVINLCWQLQSMSADHVWKWETTHLQITCTLPDHTSILSSASRFLCATICYYRPLRLSQIIHPDSICALHYTLLKICSNFTPPFEYVYVIKYLSIRQEGCNAVRVLGPCSNLRKAIMGFVMSTCPSVCPHGTIRLPLDGFSWNLVFKVFSKHMSRKLKFY